MYEIVNKPTYDTGYRHTASQLRKQTVILPRVNRHAPVVGKPATEQNGQMDRKTPQASSKLQLAQWMDVLSHIAGTNIRHGVRGTWQDEIVCWLVDRDEKMIPNTLERL